ncbi:TIGR03960 family B12-binding radical SAM protein [Thermodesulfatator indicus]|nr:TIGR03960 family B12-binding radical SAM protein [Thermodesulfatator indicus]
MSNWASRFEEILAKVRKPSRYLGREINTVFRPFEEVRLRVCLVFPDLYEVGMSHIGLLILYLILSQREDIFVDRAYAPARDLEELLRKEKIPYLSLTARRPLKDFDLIGMSFPYELCATNLVNILELSGIPLLARERRENDPIILGGGSVVSNPEPVADFYDALIIGEGEEAILEVVDVMTSAREARASRKEILNALSEIPGIYVPSFFKPVYEKGRFKALEPLKPDYEKIKRRVVPDLDVVPYDWRPIVPWMEIAHDRLALEISRGCTRGCRFCQASSFYRPVRERSPKRLLEMAEEGLAATGWDEISFLSLSAGDYTCLTELIVGFNRRFLPEKIAISLPSLRVGSLNETIISEIRKVRKTGFTLAPEAGTERLRRVINKDIREEDLFDTALKAFEAGWRHLKLYFMIGLPTETEKDLEGIVRLSKRLTRIKGRIGPQVNVSVSTFVPKPHTAFQWERQITLAETREKLTWLKKALSGRKLKFKWHKPEQSFLEGVFSRGDRRLSALILEAYRRGARLDSWSDEFNFDVWLSAAESLGLDLEDFLRPRALDEPLPWDHLDLGVTKEFLLAEREHSLAQEISPDCRYKKCLKCGVCDFKVIKNVLAKDCEFPPVEPPKIEEEGRFTYRLIYQKRGFLRFLSQIELMNQFHRAVRRAKLPVAFSEGFHPLPRISFAKALPVGVESLGEIAAIELLKQLEPDEIKFRLNQELPEEIKVLDVSFSSPKEALEVPDEVLYEIILPEPVPQEKIDAFMAKRSVTLRVRRGKKIKELELRPFVLNLKTQGNRLLLILFEPREGGVRAQEVVAALLEVSPEELEVKRIVKKQIL